MHTDEWIARESKEDRSKTFGCSLKQENYKLPMIKLTFGEEYIPVPQVYSTLLTLSAFDEKTPLKLQLYTAWCFDAGKELGISREEIKKTYENGRVPDGTGSEAEKAIFRWIEKKIQDEGPYVVLHDALMSGYSYEADWLYTEEEYAYWGQIGEIQEWEKDDNDRERE